MQMCDYGCATEGTYYFKSSKQWCCSKSANSCSGKRKKDSDKKKGKNPFEGKEHPRGMLGKKAFNKGKTNIEFYGAERANEISQKLSETIKALPHSWDLMTPEQQENHRMNARERIIARYEAGWMPKAGRCEKFLYESKIAGKVSLDGTWELAVAKWLDDNVTSWNRNTKRFQYTDDSGKLRHYTPDFWIEDWDSYLEVKGYETDLDRAKWKHFPHSLTVWKKKQLEDRKIL
jgi:hypothetical protein